MGNRSHKSMINYKIIILYCLFQKTIFGLETKSFGCECGKDPNNPEQNVYKVAEKITDEGSRIVGGEDVKNPNPWFVFLKIEEPKAVRWFRCGASLLNERFALTAAHCFCNDKKGTAEEEKSCKKFCGLANRND